jgi:hypothetical protein
MGLFHVSLLLSLISPLVGNPRSQTVTYVCILLGQEVLSPGLCFSVLTTLVQALSSDLAPTTIPSIQCSNGNQHVCFNPTYSPQKARDMEAEPGRELIHQIISICA